MLAELRQWDARYAAPLPRTTSHANNRDPHRPLRIGYVSADFCDHVCGHNLVPLFREHDRRNFELFCYSNVETPDSFTKFFQSHAQWRDIHPMSDQDAAQQVIDDRIDILVDLSLHSSCNRLLVLARKPAPVQFTFVGYPAGTGMSAIDYRLTDPYLDPPENDPFYVEKSIRLPHSFWCYDVEGMGLANSPPVVSPPALSNGFITFGCLNNFGKINDTILNTWKKVLDSVPNSRLLLLAPLGAHRQRVLAHLPGRASFVDRSPRLNYLANYNQIDLVLDTYPYNGHTTGLDALWMSVPTVTLYGQSAVSRAGLSQLSNLGLAELAVPTLDRYVELAVALANDLPRLADLRASIRRRMTDSPLMNAPAFARGVEAAYRRCWQKWCETPA